MTDVTPPKWAETTLSLVLGPEDFQTVSGDLLEQYRESVYPVRGVSGADAWYIAQVAGFVWRSSRWWACLFSAAIVGRTALDWFVPMTDFHMRSLVTTATAVALVLMAAFFSALRSRSLGAGVFAGLTTTLIAAMLSIAGSAILLAIWHDPRTLAAIEGSGGLAEEFTLPVMLVIPGLVLGTMGGLFGLAIGQFTRRAG
jgi:hypothetical protein